MKQKTKLAIAAMIAAGVLVPAIYLVCPAALPPNAEYVPREYEFAVINDIYFIGDLQVTPVILGRNFGSTPVLTRQWSYFVFPGNAIIISLAFNVQATTFNQTDVENALGESLFLSNGTAKTFVFSKVDSYNSSFYHVLMQQDGQWFITSVPLALGPVYVEKTAEISFEIYRYLKTI